MPPLPFCALSAVDANLISIDVAETCSTDGAAQSLEAKIDGTGGWMAKLLAMVACAT